MGFSNANVSQRELRDARRARVASDSYSASKEVTKPDDPNLTSNIPAPASTRRSWYDRCGLRWLRIFRVRLDRSTDILALFAFLISIAGLIYQIALFVRKPEIVQFPPTQVVFYAVESNNGKYLHIGAQSAYVNRGKGEKSAVLKAERLRFELGGKPYELKWQNFQSYWNIGDELQQGDKAPAIPTVIKAGDGASHETHFAPGSLHPIRMAEGDATLSYLPWNEFISELGKVSELDIRIIAEFYDLDSTESQVYVEVDEGMTDFMSKHRWTARSAWPRKSNRPGVAAAPTPMPSPTAELATRSPAQFFPPRVKPTPSAVESRP